MSNKSPTDTLKEKSGKLLAKNEQILVLENEIKSLEKRLNETEKKFNSIFEMENEAIFFIGRDGRFINVNQYASDLFGYTIDEFKELHAYDLMADTEAQDYKERWDEIWDGEVLPIYERIFQRKDGSTFPAEINPTMVYDESGQPLYYQSFVRDISKRKYLENAREIERRSFKIIVDAVSKHSDVSNFCTEILKELKEILRFDYGCFRVLDKEKTKLHISALLGFPKNVDKKFEEQVNEFEIFLMDNVVKPKSLLTSGDVLQDKRMKSYQSLFKHLNVRSIIASPLLGTNNEIIGTFQISSINSKTINDDEMRFIGIISGILANSIEKLLAEEALTKAYKEREELNQIISMSSAIVVLWRNEPEWPVEFITNNVTQQWGYSPEEFYSGKAKFYDIVPKEDAKRVDKIVQEKSKIYDLNEYVIDYRIRTKDNKIRWIREFTSLRKDSKGEITHYRSIIIDDTERKLIEEKQKRERHVFQIIADAALFSVDIEILARKILSGIMTAFDFDVGTIRLFDKTERTLIPIADIGKKRWISENKAKPISIDNQDYFIAHVARTKKAMYAPDTTKAALSEKHKERIKFIQMKSQVAWPILNSRQELLGTFIIGAYEQREIQEGDREFFETIAGMFSTALERMLSDKALKSSEEKLKILNEELEDRVNERTKELQKTISELEEFSYTISHDLRSPLRGINGLTHLLSEEYTSIFDEQANEYFTRIQEATNKMGTLIDDLLDFSKISRFAFKRSEINLSAYVATIFDNIKDLNPECKVKIKIKKNVRVNADPRLVRILLFNLLDNAVKFTKNSEKPIITFGSKKIKNDYYYFIKDNGTGFDVKYEETIFKPFQRLHSSDEYRGYGIGLATVKRIIERHQGKIWVDSKIGEGSTFYFTLNENEIKK